MQRGAFILVVLLLASSVTSLVNGADPQVTIHRDTWGVPHIYADSPASGAYGLGYAQAEDRLHDIYMSIRTGTGTMAEFFGPKLVEQDYIMRLCKNEEIARKSLATMPSHLRTMIESFTAGVQAYVDEHPEEVPEFAVKLEPWQILTVSRAMMLRWPLGTINDEKDEKPNQRPPMGSNEWAVAPSRSADNVPILLSDPHLTWEGLAVLYEARVHAGDVHMNGYFLIGAPLLGIGHNQHVGWALTTGGPDTADVYQMKIRAGKKQLEYEYDGEWKPVTMRLFAIPVKGEKPAIKPALYTHLGPVIAEPDLKAGTALVGAAPLLEMTGTMQQGYDMVMSKNSREFFQAVGRGEFNPQNVMFADVHGDIGYVRCGVTPDRPEGYQWDRPVPGHTSETKWKGIHPVEDLVHIFNPPQGYMQNCNISPINMMVDSPFTRDKYRDYIYNVSWDEENPRSMRIRSLLHDDASVTREEAIAYSMDVFDVHAQRWQQELKLAVDAVGKDKMANAPFAAAVKCILEWNGHFTPEATATSLYKFWRLKLGREMDLKCLANGGHFNAQQQAQALDVLHKTIEEMQTKYGKWDVAWGDIHKVGRDEQLFPAGGCEFDSGYKEVNFSETLFDVRSTDDPARSGHYVANSGSMAVILMFFHKDGIESLTCTPWGQSGRPKSPHFMDQGEKLYSKLKMKPTWWAEKDLKANVESTRTLAVKAWAPN